MCRPVSGRRPARSLWHSLARQTRQPTIGVEKTSAASLKSRLSGAACLRLSGLPIEPHILHAPAIEQAVDDQREALHPLVRAGSAAREENDRSGHVLGQLAFELPNQLTALLDIRLGRLLLYELIEFRVAIPGVVAFGAADVILEKHLVRIVERRFGNRQ